MIASILCLAAAVTVPVPPSLSSSTSSTGSSAPAATGRPTLLLKSDGSAMTTPLNDWQMHPGDLAVLSDPQQPDSLDLDELFKSLAGDSWQDRRLPLTLGTHQRDAEHTDPAAWWLVAQFVVSPEAAHRTVVLWLDIGDSLLDVYVNGQRIGSRGDHHRELVMLRSPVAPGFVIPAGLLHADAPNSVVLAGWNPLINISLATAELIDLTELPSRLFWRHSMPLMLDITMAVMLLAIGVYSLVWTLRRPEERENLYLAVGTAGWACCFATNWMPWLPSDGAITLAVATVSLASATFFALYFQFRYKIHTHRATPFVASGFAAATALLCLVIGDAVGIMQLLKAIMPVALLSFAYALYLNIAAARQNNREARVVLAGYALFVLGAGADIIGTLQFSEQGNLLSCLGIGALAVSIFLSMTMRFSSLHESSNEFVERLRRKQEVQDYLIHQIAEVASAIDMASQHIVTSASQQQLGATEQSTAVEQTRRTMEALLTSGRNITTAAQDVLKNAEMTQHHNHAVAERISESSTHSRRISEILDIIRDIANKSELLALNAALEGSRAGEAGRGFALVASQMQRLAENVMSAVSDIKDLTSDIRTASSATETSTLQAATLASETTDSVHKIGLIIEEQQAGTEQVTRAMDDVAKIAQQTAHSGQTTLERTQVLLERATSLRGLVEQYRSGN